MSELYYDPYDYEIDANPHPLWKRLRDETERVHTSTVRGYAKVPIRF